MDQPITKCAVILAAGWGSRVQGLSEDEGPVSKPLILLEGAPMVVRVIRTLASEGIGEIVVVTGYLRERVEETVMALDGENGLKIRTVFNPRWDDLANGVSLLAAEPLVDGPFILTMSDHVYDASIVGDLIRQGDEGKAVRLCIDRKLDRIFDMDDATKVKTELDRIVAIDKRLKDFNAVDIGLFLCNTDVFSALGEALEKNGDCSLSDGMRILGKNGRFGYFDIGGRYWQDVDTPEMLSHAEEMLATGGIRFSK